MLKTYETEPQVLVQVGEHPAVCHNLTCDFKYIVPVGEVIEYSFDNSTNTLVVNGTDLPVNKEDIRHIEFAHSKCKIQEIKTVNATVANHIVSQVPCSSINNSSNSSANNNSRRLLRKGLMKNSG